MPLPEHEEGAERGGDEDQDAQKLEQHAQRHEATGGGEAFRVGRRHLAPHLAEQSAEQISTLAGKTKLQGDLKVALNKMLKAKTGKAPVDDVYFTNFIVQ